MTATVAVTTCHLITNFLLVCQFWYWAKVYTASTELRNTSGLMLLFALKFSFWEVNLESAFTNFDKIDEKKTHKKQSTKPVILIKYILPCNNRNKTETLFRLSVEFEWSAFYLLNHMIMNDDRCQSKMQNTDDDDFYDTLIHLTSNHIQKALFMTAFFFILVKSN